MSIACNKAQNYCLIELKGMVTNEQIMHNFDAAVSHIDYQDGMARIWDFREADLSLLDAGTIRALSMYSMKFPEGINNVKVAFIVKRDLELGLTNMFKGFAVHANTPIEIFKSIEAAVIWIAS